MQVSETLQRLHADARVIAAVEAQGKKSGTPGLFSTAAPCHFAFCVSRLCCGPSTSTTLRACRVYSAQFQLFRALGNSNEVKVPGSRRKATDGGASKASLVRKLEGLWSAIGGRF